MLNSINNFKYNKQQSAVTRKHCDVMNNNSQYSNNKTVQKQKNYNKFTCNECIGCKCFKL